VISTFLCGRKVSLWYVLSGTYTVFTYILILSGFTSPSLSSLISCPSPNIRKLIHKQVAGVKCLALKMGHH
jgi:hypothetical protein